MEWPRPQPGQKSIPSILKTQNEKCVSVPGDINASNVNDAIQNVNSKYLNIFFVILFRLCDTTRAIPVAGVSPATLILYRQWIK